MSLALSVDASNDLFRGMDGNIALASGVVAVMQGAQIAAQTQRGEMIYATDRGIPNFTVVWQGSPNVPQFRSFLRRELLLVAGVVDVPSLNAEASGGKLSYRASIRTIYGVVPLNG